MNTTKMINEKKLCPKGRKYYDSRIKAGEKPSAYLSGRAVKVCKGLIDETEDCGCNGPKLMINENQNNIQISEGLRYHIVEGRQLIHNIYRPFSDKYFALFNEVRDLYNKGLLSLTEYDIELIESNIGEFVYIDGFKIPLDYPLTEGEIIRENEKKVALNKPHRGGSKKFYVYVKDPKTKRIKKVSFGDTTGLKAKINNPKARQAFSKRHDCPNKKDKTKASYWSCRIGRYWKQLGGSQNFSGYW